MTIDSWEMSANMTKNGCTLCRGAKSETVSMAFCSKAQSLGFGYKKYLLMSALQYKEWRRYKLLKEQHFEGFLFFRLIVLI